ncbi:NADH-quinone oxidoreductase subunit N [Ereboglobus sp. PH5-5]|uniref:NADH-quinone oxidoreductase subunit N n=1 Tax=Ereboglobus sp. PH5-5 TaxID=2940529 RepID=UPI0024056C06|nr:NADH-quinone oxidoreductase subunit N [Ereboglobus sp. PH5-5]MDF9833298.1 NADH-quinone oxidoreductase subunit N [Ereboglobus sp. PH5-5]
MTSDFITNIARAGAQNGWVLITPEILLAGLALLLLVFELALPKAMRRFIPAISIVGQICVLAAALLWALEPKINGSTLTGSIFYGMLKFTPTGQFFRVFFVVTSILVHAIAMISLPKQRVPRVEFFHIVLVITAAMMLLAQASHFLMLFVALETITVGFYVLVSYYRASAFSLEAGLKYLVLGSLSSGLLLFGIVLLYGMAGNPAAAGRYPMLDPLSYLQVHHFLANNSGNFIGNLGVLLVLSGIAFKIGLVPFQIWIPDVYQGAPTPVTAFLSVGSKVAGFALLFTLLPIISPVFRMVVPLLVVVTFATIIFGNLAALTQYNVKRLMGLSGVSHAGFLMMGIVAGIHLKGSSDVPLFIYIIAYTLASFAVFGVMALVAGENDAEQEFSDYHGLAKRNPFLAAVLVVALGSLAGLPPLFGFMGKLLIFIDAFQAGFYWLLAVAILAVVVSIYYYFGWIRAAFFQNWQSSAVPDETPVHPADRIKVPVMMRLLLIVLTLSTLCFGLYQKPVIEFLNLLKIF